VRRNEGKRGGGKESAPRTRRRRSHPTPPRALRLAARAHPRSRRLSRPTPPGRSRPRRPQLLGPRPPEPHSPTPPRARPAARASPPTRSLAPRGRLHLAACLRCALLRRSHEAPRARPRRRRGRPGGGRAAAGGRRARRRACPFWPAPRGRPWPRRRLRQRRSSPRRRRAPLLLQIQLQLLPHSRPSSPRPARARHLPRARRPRGAGGAGARGASRRRPSARTGRGQRTRAPRGGRGGRGGERRRRLFGRERGDKSQQVQAGGRREARGARHAPRCCWRSSLALVALPKRRRASVASRRSASMSSVAVWGCWLLGAVRRWAVGELERARRRSSSESESRCGRARVSSGMAVTVRGGDGPSASAPGGRRASRRRLRPRCPAGRSDEGGVSDSERDEGERRGTHNVG